MRPRIKGKEKKPETSKSKNKFGRCGYGKTHKKCPAMGQQCALCKKMNHYVKSCRSKEFHYLEDIGLSPAQLLMGRRLKNELPMMESLLTPTNNNQNEISKHLKKTKEQKKKNDDRYASKSMQELEQGTNVRMQPETDSKLWRAATVLRHHHTPRSYVVQTEDGRNYRRNRQHLRVCPAPEQEINPELSLENRANLTVAKEESNQAAPPAVLPDPPSQEQHSQLPKESSGTPYVTRRDRQVVKPNRLDL